MDYISLRCGFAAFGEEAGTLVERTICVNAGLKHSQHPDLEWNGTPTGSHLMIMPKEARKFAAPLRHSSVLLLSGWC